MQAIVTRYHGATNTRGARYSARADAGRVSIPAPITAEDGHNKALLALLLKLGWTPAEGKAYAGYWARGSAPGQTDGYTYVLTSNVADYNQGLNTWALEEIARSAAALRA